MFKSNTPFSSWVLNQAHELNEVDFLCCVFEGSKTLENEFNWNAAALLVPSRYDKYDHEA